MADPLSLTLAAVTLASALKEIVELAQMIQESCEKVSRNRHELRSLASEVKTTVFQLKKFSDDHYDILCDAGDMKASLLSLITDMRAICDRCCEMFPPIPPKRLEKFKVAFTVWRNRNRMEDVIKDLMNRVNKCHSQFMMFAVMRIESHLVVIRRQHKVDRRRSRQEVVAVGASDDNMITVVGPNSTRASSKLPLGITADFIADTYICLQIETIDGILTQLSSNSYPVEQPSKDFVTPFEVRIALAPPYDKYTIRQELVRGLLQIQSYLRSDSEDLSIQAGALAMLNLGAGLGALELHKEVFTSTKWAVNIFRTLAKPNPNTYLPYLVASLRNLSVSYFKVNDIDGSFSAIEEAVDISRSFRHSTANIEIEFQFAHVLALFSSRLGLMNNHEESLKAAQESVDIYNTAMDKNHEQMSCGLPVRRFNSHWESFFESIPRPAIIRYGWALDQLSHSFEQLGRLEDSFNTAKKALDVIAFYANSIINDVSEIEMADILLQISHEDYQKFSSLEEALSFSERAVALYRAHCLKDVEKHGISLCMALCRQADILAKMGRDDEALAVCRKTVDLANDIIADQLTRAGALRELSWTFRRLEHYDEAVMIRTQSVTVYSEYTENKARDYYDLGVELDLADRWPEAIKAFEAALTQYRALAFKDSETYSKYIGWILNQLTTIFTDCKEFDQAFNEGHDSLELHQSLLENDALVLDEYIFAVRLNCCVVEVADNEEKCVERARQTITYARNIAGKHPSEGNPLLFEVIRRSAMVLYRFNRVSEAEMVIQEALEWHERNPSQDEENVEEYMRCLYDADVIVYTQGHSKKGAQYLEKSINIGKPHSSDKSISAALVRSMYSRVQSLYISGLYGEAVEASKEYIAFARQSPGEDIDALVECLDNAVTALQNDEKLDEDIVHIQEALQLSCSTEIIELSNTQPYILLLEAQSLIYLSGILAGTVLQEVLSDLVVQKADMEEDLGFKSKNAFLPWSYIEPAYYYIDVFKTYSLYLANNDDVSSHLDQLSKVRSFYESRINSRLGDSLQLGRVLHVEGILCCASGRPDDGAVAVAKLRNLQSRLHIVHPELDQNVEIALKRQRTSPSMAALIKKLDLKCGHQH